MGRKFVDDEVSDRFNEYLAERMAPHRALLGVGDRPALLLGRRPGDDDATIRLRRAVLWALGSAGDAQVLAAAKATAERWIEEPTSIDADVVGLAIPLAGRRMDERLFASMASEVERPRRPETRGLALASLGYLEDRDRLRRALELTLRLDLPLEDVDAFFWDATVSPRTRSVVYDWIASEWGRITYKWRPESRWPVVGVISRACDDEQREKLERIMRPKDRSEWFEQRIEAALQCRELRRFGGNSLSAFLRAQRGAKSPSP